MKNPNKKRNLNKVFTELYQVEKQARDTYNGFLKTLKDKKEIRIIKKIRDDEIRHMRIVKEILKLIK